MYMRSVLPFADDDAAVNSLKQQANSKNRLVLFSDIWNATERRRLRIGADILITSRIAEVTCETVCRQCDTRKGLGMACPRLEWWAGGRA